MDTDDICWFCLKKFDQLGDLHIEAHIICTHGNHLYIRIILTVSYLTDPLEAGVKMWAPPAQILLEMVAGLDAFCALRTETESVHCTWHDDLND